MRRYYKRIGPENAAERIFILVTPIHRRVVLRQAPYDGTVIMFSISDRYSLTSKLKFNYNNSEHKHRDGTDFL